MTAFPWAVPWWREGIEYQGLRREKQLSESSSLRNLTFGNQSAIQATSRNIVNGNNINLSHIPVVC
jgi:hypothetical protein